MPHRLVNRACPVCSAVLADSLFKRDAATQGAAPTMNKIAIPP